MEAIDLLWRVNNEYRKRLARVDQYVTLLEQLLVTRDPTVTADYLYLLEVLRYVRQQLAVLAAEHRGWRYSYYYTSADDKRMVHADGDVHRALAYFSRMRTRHERALTDVCLTLAGIPRPDPALTDLPNGDLWLLMQYSIDALAAFVDRPDAV